MMDAAGLGTLTALRFSGVQKAASQAVGSAVWAVKETLKETEHMSTVNVRGLKGMEGSPSLKNGYTRSPQLAGRSVRASRVVEPRDVRPEEPCRVERQESAARHSSGKWNRLDVAGSRRVRMVKNSMMQRSEAGTAPAVRDRSGPGGLSRPSVGVRAGAEFEVAWVVVARRAITLAGALSIVVLVVWSAVLAKTSGQVLPLAAIRIEPIGTSSQPPVSLQSRDAELVQSSETLTENEPAAVPLPRKQEPVAKVAKSSDRAAAAWANDPQVRWFNGRPAKPDRTIWMRVTAYSPDHRSCGTSDDGLTATMHSVETNGFRLVAADPKVLAYGSMVSIEGYDKGHIVPVLDCGGAIKGNHIDLLFPTHEQAIQWGSKLMNVVVWKYIDGKPAENPRKVR